MGVAAVSSTSSAVSRREVSIELAAKGRRLVDAVTERRRIEIATIVANIPIRERAATVQALHALGDAASEPRDAAWFVGTNP